MELGITVPCTENSAHQPKSPRGARNSASNIAQQDMLTGMLG